MWCYGSLWNAWGRSTLLLIRSFHVRIYWYFTAAKHKKKSSADCSGIRAALTLKRVSSETKNIALTPCTLLLHHLGRNAVRSNWTIKHKKDKLATQMTKRSTCRIQIFPTSNHHDLLYSLPVHRSQSDQCAILLHPDRRNVPSTTVS